MCGITGFFEITPQRAKADRLGIGQKMAATLAHRGPDDEGLWQDDNLPLLLAHRRLSIVDLSPEGHQPMMAASGRYVMVFNGEIYNFATLRQELESHGIPFRGRSDTEIMLAGFDHWGINATLQKLNGMFAFALYDKKEQTLHFVRDRLGKKPLYLGWAGKNLVFGSELKALRAHPDFTPEIDRNVLALYIRYGYVPAPYSIYKNIVQLLPGCRITLKLNEENVGRNLQALMEPYWHMPRIIEEAQHKQSALTDSETITEFESLLTTCVKDRMVSDVPLGAFLSGGIDSSAIVALMQKTAAHPVQTFSIGFHETGFDEAVHAKAVAQHLGTNHHELYVTPQEARDIIPQLPQIYDEPFADVSQIPTYLVSKFARQHVTVALSGDGGDEMLGGYNRHVIVPELWRRVGWMPRAMRQMLARIITSLPQSRWDELVRSKPQIGEKLYKIAALLPLHGPQEIYRALMSQWPEPDNIVFNGTEPHIPLNDPAWQAKDLSFAQRMMAGDTLSYLPNDILTKVDRASMAASLEVRAPLLDRQIFEYVWGLPHEMKIRNGQGKWLLRKVLARHVPREMFTRPKQGFGVPIGDWLRGPLREWAETLLDEKQMTAQGYLNPAPIRAAWKEHLQGKGHHAHKLWTVLMFQQWLLSIDNHS